MEISNGPVSTTCSTQPTTMVLELTQILGVQNLVLIGAFTPPLLKTWMTEQDIMINITVAVKG